ncbi:SDR family NAD(P)-dependent oxidoreductase [Deinococcus arenicola]|uniref:SDR family NAD(P)-dependent oxidoreductase n=1 Tax=Deinococcus arenicola TaxID=2994950 RepID=A0ABU4DN30_9DEIO|nr:SDR family NAD(P)-dependent oxidoreductase [Deinococcus sp. ZS9-10]MDV6373839.1 SDR family NAD(P)-dependent oxidoreductase [Deinococcus sp. ZS9-10]
MGVLSALVRLLLSPPACRDSQRLAAAIEGKTVVITGASYGIGEATALLLASCGAEVLLLARSAERLEEVAGEIRAAGGKASVYRLDLADPQAIGAVAAQMEAQHPRIHTIISNAGHSIRRPVLHSAEKDDLGRLLAVNFSGPATLLLALLPRMVAQGGGVVVSVSSASALPPGIPRWAAYQGSKAGFDVWLGSLGNELRGRGVRVASVYLPLVRTRMIAPTRAYRFAPALTPLEAAQSVVYPLIQPVRRVAPWWLAGQQIASLLFPNVLDRALSGMEQVERRLSRRREK